MNEYSQRNVRFAKALKEMFKNVQSGNKLYIVFSKFSFRLLVFTLAMGIIANIILAYLVILQITGSLTELSTILYIALVSLCIAATVSGIYLVFKGIDIVTDK